MRLKKEEQLKLYWLFDRTIDADEITDEMLNELRLSFNELFGSTSPAQEIMVWGNLIQYLKAPFFKEVFEEEEDFGEDVTDIMDVEVYPMVFLKHLLYEGQFDENNP